MEFISAVSSPAGANQSDLEWEHEVPTSGLALVIGVASSSDQVQGIIGPDDIPTVNGVPATPIPGSYMSRDDTPQPIAMQAFIVRDVAVGTAEIAFSSDHIMQFPAGGSLLLADVGDLGEVMTRISEGNPATSQLLVESEDGGGAVDFVQFIWHSAGRELSPTGDNTQRVSVTSAETTNGTILRGSTAPGAAEVDMSWANAGGFMAFMHLAVPILASGDEPEPDPPTLSTAELAFGSEAGADVIDVFISAASEFTTSAFSWLGSAVTGLSTFVSAAFSWGTSLSAPRPTLLQRVTAGLEWGVRFIGTAAGIPMVVESAYELVQTGAAFVRSGARMIGNALRSIIRRY